MIDSHCHLNFKAFNDNYREVVDRAKQIGVEAIVCPSTYKESSERAIELTKEFPEWVYPAVGHHPIHVKTHPFDVESYRKLARDPKVVAIGEVGLDLFRIEEKEQLEDQKIMLRKFVSLAVEINKPIILHCRDAYLELISLLKEFPIQPKGVLHCLVTHEQKIIDEFLNLGYLIGFTGIITYPKNDELREVVKNIPIEKILVETDSPFLAPQNHRGKQNEPANVKEVIETIAYEREESFKNIEQATCENAKKLFRIK